ncbi:MAG: right-handed parallel beta-helix repeat-containing protein [Verrucomicrobia bacterium]|nr:right-handed parallel beta-helix repeat-containing protein [Verrucomicrobiota bacterium]
MRHIIPAILLGSTMAHAAQITVTNNAASGAGSLLEAIATANGNSEADTILFAPSLNGQTIPGGGYTITSELTIDASALGAGVILDAGYVDRVMYITTAASNVVLRNLTLINGFATDGTPDFVNFQDFGGGLYNEGASTLLDNCRIRFNVSSYQGGGIYNFGTLTLTNCEIRGNSAQNNNTSAPTPGGGGIYNAASGSLTVRNSDIAGNSSAGLGGGLYSLNQALIVNSTFAGNTAQTSGGGIHSAGGTMTLTDSTVVSNRTLNAPVINTEGGLGDSGGAGGGLYLAGGTLFAHKVAWAFNTTGNGSSGGPTNNLFCGKGGNGGALFITNATASISSSSFTFNRSGEGGNSIGGIGGDGGNGGDGAGIYGLSGALDLFDCSFSFNTNGAQGIGFSSAGFPGSGGAIYSLRSMTTTVRRCLFEGNYGFSGGGIYSYTPTDFSDPVTRVENSTFIGNEALQEGGGYYNYGGKSELLHCTIVGNQAPDDRGSGVASYGDSLTLTEVKNSIIESNVFSDVDIVQSVSFNSFTSQGYNLVGTGNATNAFVQAGDSIGNLLNLGALGDYGGPTRSLIPLPGSPAINAGVVSVVGTDQRGVSRMDGAPDIGAVELTTNTVVNNLFSTGPGSLPYILEYPLADPAITNAITFDPALDGETLLVEAPLIVRHPGTAINAGGLTNGFTLRAVNSNQVIRILAGTTNVYFEGITIRDGYAGTGNGGGIEVGVGAQLSLRRVAVVDCQAGAGAGIAALSGASLEMANCSILRNRTVESGGLGIGGGIFNVGTLSLDACTIAGNSARLYSGGVENRSVLFLNNSLIADNDAVVGPDIYKALGALNALGPGTNLIGNLSDSGFTAGPQILVDPEPLLSPPGLYGGPSWTAPPTFASPARDRAGFNPALPQDQRGVSRSLDGGPDIGAAEYVDVLVSNDDDSGPGSLRAALATPFVSAPRFAPALAHARILLESPLQIQQSVDLDATVFPYGLVMDAQEQTRVLEIAAGIPAVELNGWTLTGGRALDLGDGNGAGIKINPGAEINLRNCTLFNHIALFTGGGIYNQGSLLLDRSTLYHCGSGALNVGGGLANDENANAEIQYSTFIGNVSGSGGAIVNQAGGRLVVRHSTLSGNRALTSGGAIFNRAGGGFPPDATLELHQSIVAGNIADTAADLDNDGVVLSSSGVNLFSDLSGSGLGTGATIRLVEDIRLSPLGWFGGRTQTLHPLAGSPAIDPAGSLTNATVDGDQRGLTNLVGGLRDVGAIEVGSVHVVADTEDLSMYALNLRNALDQAVTPGAVIRFSTNTFPATMTLTQELVVAEGRVVFLDASDMSGPIVIDAQGGSRHFLVASNATLAIHGLTLTGGSSTNDGGSIEARPGSYLTVNQSTLYDNACAFFGGALNVYGRAVLNRSTLTANTGWRGGALTTQQSGETLLRNATLSGNEASGAVFPGAGGGGMHALGRIGIHNTIIAGNQATGSGSGAPDVFTSPIGSIAPRTGINLLSDLSLSGLINHDPAIRVEADPLLMPLGDYGGSTPTLPPRAASPAIDRISLFDLWALFPRDQRGAPRTGDGDIGAVEAQPIVVTTTHDADPGSLRHAITWYADLDPITFTSTLANVVIPLTNGVLRIERPVAVDGTSLAQPPVLDGLSVSPIFRVEATNGPVALAGLKMINGANTNIFPGGSGGAMYFLPGTTSTVRQVEISDSTAAIFGGAFITEGTTTFEDSRFVNNVAIAGGAGMLLAPSNQPGRLSLLSCVFTNNQATGSDSFGGGALFALSQGDSAVLNISGGLFEANTASNSFGGALMIFTRVGSVTGLVSSVTMRENTAFGGGAVLNGAEQTNAHVSLSILDSDIVDNSAFSVNPTFGGGIYQYAGPGASADLSLDGVFLSGNFIGFGDGAGLASRGFQSQASSVSIIRSLISSNEALFGAGGGLYVTNAVMTMETSTLLGNSSGTDGGGLFYTGSGLSLVNSTLHGNLGVGDGGAAYLASGSSQISHVTVTSNRAAQGAGFFVAGPASLQVNNAIVAQNSSTGSAFTADFANLGLVTATGTNVVGNNVSVAGIFPSDGIRIGGGSFPVVDPILSPIAPLDSRTPVRFPLPGSPAVAAADPAQSPPLDQRGQLRDLLPDIGAVEASTLIVTTPNDETDGITTGGISLREALDVVDTGGSVRFDSFVDGKVIALDAGNGPLVIDRNLTVDASQFGRTVTLDAQDEMRVLAVTNGAQVTLRSLTITGGKAESNLGGYFPNSGGGLLLYPGSTGLLFNVAVVGNRSDSGGGFGGGGGIAVMEDGLLVMKNSTVANNQSHLGGGIYADQGAVEISHVTVAQNTAGQDGGGIYNFGTLEFFNTLIADNQAAGQGPDLRQEAMATLLPPQGVNLLSDLSGSTLTAGSSVLEADPLFAGLGVYGNKHTILPLRPGSPAIDALPFTFFIPLDDYVLDQRGAPRDGTKDIGAVEFVSTVVTTEIDEDNVNPGTGRSLREALNNPYSTTITFDFPLAGKTNTAVHGSLNIDRAVEIDASSLSDLFVLSGASTWRVMTVASNAGPVRLDSLGFTFGVATGDTVIASSGGALYSEGDVSIHRSRFAYNSAQGGGGGAIAALYGNHVIDQSLIVSNWADDVGGGVLNAYGDMVISNSTVSGNQSVLQEGGGVFNGEGTTTIHHATIVENMANGTGGGIYCDSGAPKVFLHNSIVANNVSWPGLTPDDVNASLNLSGDNIIEKRYPEISIFTLPATLSTNDPQIAPLADLGGPTWGHYPLPGSPAINAATSTSTSVVDQRGLPRDNEPDIGAVEASVLMVNTTADQTNGVFTGGVALREAVDILPFGGQVLFDPSVFPATIALSFGELSMSNRALTVDASTLSGPVTVDGQFSTPVFAAREGSRLVLDNLEITRGMGIGGQAGGLTLNGSTAVVRKVILTANQGLGTSPGGISLNGGSELLMEDSTLLGNASVQDGGGILVDTTSRLLANRILIASNRADRFGGGILNNGISILTNVTLTANDAQNAGGGVFNGSGSDLRLVQATVVDNTATNTGGGIEGSFFTLQLENSIVTANQAPSSPDFGLSVVPTILGGALTSGDPQLAPLGNYGGPTLTRPPYPGSAAIDGGTTLASTPAVDQRGLTRPVDGTLDGTNRVDLGAAEFTPVTDYGYAWNTDGDEDGMPFGTEIALGRNPFLPDSGGLNSLQLVVTSGLPSPVASLNRDALPFTEWVISRSTNLLTGTFEVAGRFSGPSEQVLSGNLSTNATQLILVEGAPSLGPLFYRFEAVFHPPASN